MLDNYFYFFLIFMTYSPRKGMSSSTCVWCTMGSFGPLEDLDKCKCSYIVGASHGFCREQFVTDRERKLETR